MNRYLNVKEVETAYGKRIEKSITKWAIIDPVVALVTIIVLFVFWPWQSVPTGYRGVVTQFGEIKRVEGEGLHFVKPWESLTNFNLRAKTAHVEKAEAATIDTQPVVTGLTVRYNIVPNKLAHVYEQYSHDGDLSSYVETATMESFKAVTAQFTATELIKKRAEVSDRVWKALNTKLEKYGANVLNIDMTQFAFSKEYMHSINQKTTEEQNKQLEDNKLQTVISREQQKVEVAKAAATVTRENADATAYSELKIATAKADAMKLQNVALQQSKDVLELKRIEVELEKARKWDGQLPTNMYGSAPIPFIDIDKK